MQHRIIWIHGIGPHSAGYSTEWQTNFNQYLHLQPHNYVEVLWESVFDAATSGTRSVEGDGSPIALTPQEQAAEQEVREELATILLARQSALEQAGAQAITRGTDDRVVEWSELYGARATRGPFDWLLDADEYLGDFTKYLVSRNVRNAVKEKAKEQLRPLARDDYRISVVGHSWGSVVGYDSLLDLEAEVPRLKVAHLITLGSPLWLVRRFLEDRSGRKPGEVARWLNIHARGDLVGSWLSRGFRVDKEWEVPNVGGVGAHSSYFVPNNEAVQRDIIAGYVLGDA